jgi:hypothetical protein
MITGFRNAIFVGRFLIVLLCFCVGWLLVFTELWLFRCFRVCVFRVTMGLDVEIPARELFIGGEWAAPIKGKYLPVINPSTEEICGKSS